MTTDLAAALRLVAEVVAPVDGVERSEYRWTHVHAHLSSRPSLVPPSNSPSRCFLASRRNTWRIAPTRLSRSTRASQDNRRGNNDDDDDDDFVWCHDKFDELVESAATTAESPSDPPRRQARSAAVRSGGPSPQSSGKGGSTGGRGKRGSRSGRGGRGGERGAGGVTDDGRLEQEQRSKQVEQGGSQPGDAGNSPYAHQENNRRGATYPSTGAPNSESDAFQSSPAEQDAPSHFQHSPQHPQQRHSQQQQHAGRNTRQQRRGQTLAQRNASRNSPHQQHHHQQQQQQQQQQYAYQAQAQAQAQAHAFQMQAMAQAQAQAHHAQAHHAMAPHMQQPPIPMASSMELQHMHISHQQPGDVEYMHAQGNGMFYPPDYMMYEHDQMGWYGHGEHEGIPGADPGVGGLVVEDGGGTHDGVWVSSTKCWQAGVSH